MTGGSQKSGSSRGFAPPDGFDPAPLFKHSQGSRTQAHASDLFDVPARDGLTVGDDGERLERRPGETLGSVLVLELEQIGSRFGCGFHAPAARDFAKPQTAFPPKGRERLEKLENVRVREFVVKEPPKFAHREGLFGREERRFQNVFAGKGHGFGNEDRSFHNDRREPLKSRGPCSEGCGIIPKALKARNREMAKICPMLSKPCAMRNPHETT